MMKNSLKQETSTTDKFNKKKATKQNKKKIKTKSINEKKKI